MFRFKKHLYLYADAKVLGKSSALKKRIIAYNYPFLTVILYN